MENEPIKGVKQRMNVIKYVSLMPDHAVDVNMKIMIFCIKWCLDLTPYLDPTPITLSIASLGPIIGFNAYLT